MRSVSVAIAATLTLLASMTPAAADPAAGRDWIRSTTTTFTLDETADQARSGPEHAMAGTDADDVLRKVAAGDYDYISPSDCAASDEADEPGGWIKNRFAWCKRDYKTESTAKACDPQRPDVCVIHGKLRTTFTVIGYGEHTQDPDRPSRSERYLGFGFHVTSMVPTGVFLNPEATYSLSMRCYTNGPPADCSAPTANGALRPVSHWQRDWTASVEFISQAQPPARQHGDQFVHGEVTVLSLGQVPGYLGAEQAEHPATSIRFDSSWYNGTAKRGSIFYVPDPPGEARPHPFLTFSSAANSGYKEVADHLDQALNRPKETKPPFSDKQLPGKSMSNPLHRLVEKYDGDGGYSEKRVAANRYEAKAWGCDPYFPRWNEPRWPPDDPDGPDSRPAFECDEYPFASTFEGAGRWKYPADEYGGARHQNMFSARPVFWRDNKKAGEVLLAWYNWDRIAHKDAFFIRVR